MPAKSLPTRTNKIGLSYLQYYRDQNAYHGGIDYNYGNGNEDKGQLVYACDWGVVEYVSPPGFNGGLGHYFVLRHDDCWTRYLHNDSVFVSKDQKVAPEQEIARVGNSGTTSAHLHFEVLTGLGLLYIRDWHRPYGRYWGGLSKARVSEMTRDPEEWLGVPGRTFTQKWNQTVKALRWAVGARAIKLNNFYRFLQRLT